MVTHIADPILDISGLQKAYRRVFGHKAVNQGIAALGQGGGVRAEAEASERRAAESFGQHADVFVHAGHGWVDLVRDHADRRLAVALHDHRHAARGAGPSRGEGPAPGPELGERPLQQRRGVVHAGMEDEASGDELVAAPLQPAGEDRLESRRRRDVGVEDHGGLRAAGDEEERERRGREQESDDHHAGHATTSPRAPPRRRRPPRGDRSASPR